MDRKKSFDQTAARNTATLSGNYDQRAPSKNMEFDRAVSRTVVNSSLEEIEVKKPQLKSVIQ